MLDQLNIRFDKAAMIEMFQFMDSDRDNKLTYEDFVNLKYDFMAAIDHSDEKKGDASSGFSKSTITSNQDPYINMSKDIFQRTEFDLAEMDDEVQGSQE